MAPASRATFVKDIRAMVESFCINFVSDVSRTDNSSCHVWAAVFTFKDDTSVLGRGNVPKLSAY